MALGTWNVWTLKKYCIIFLTHICKLKRKLSYICDNCIGEGGYFDILLLGIYYWNQYSMILETMSKNFSIIHGFTRNVDNCIIFESVDKYHYFITFVTFINISSILLVYTEVFVLTLASKSISIVDYLFWGVLPLCLLYSRHINDHDTIFMSLRSMHIKQYSIGRSWI